MHFTKLAFTLCAAAAFSVYGVASRSNWDRELASREYLDELDARFFSEPTHDLRRLSTRDLLGLLDDYLVPRGVTTFPVDHLAPGGTGVMVEYAWYTPMKNELDLRIAIATAVARKINSEMGTKGELLATDIRLYKLLQPKGQGTIFEPELMTDQEPLTLTEDGPKPPVGYLLRGEKLDDRMTERRVVSTLSHVNGMPDGQLNL